MNQADTTLYVLDSALYLRHNYRNDRQADPRRSRCPPKATASMPRSGPSLEEGTLNPAPGKVQDPKFQEGEFFDPRDIVQVKYEMLRRVSVENASVTVPTEEYGVSRPTYYQTKASFEEAGIAGLVPRKRGPRGPHKLRGEVLAFIQEQLVAGEPVRARELAKLIRTEIRSRCPPENDRASGRGKKNSAMTLESWSWFGAAVDRRGAIRNSTQCRARPCAAARGSLGAPALSPSRHVGMGAGDGHGWREPAAAAETWSSR